MRNKIHSILSGIIILSMLLSGCSAVQSIQAIGKKTTISIVFGSEKQDWLNPLIDQFNKAGKKTAAGVTIEVQGSAMGSIEAVDGIIGGSIQPTVWSPASSVYIPVANAEWRKTHNTDLVGTDSKDLVLSPVVIAMWKPMAEALGYPQKPIGWEEITKLATSDKGWEQYNYPEGGAFKFGHTHPGYSNSGLVAMIAQVYAASGKQRGLSLDDLKDPMVRSFVQDVQSSIIHYGTSTGFFATKMFDMGPSYLSAAVLYENLVVSQEAKRLNGTSQQTPVVAIYPKEGTFWANHPYAILNAPWVTAEQKDAAAVSAMPDKIQDQFLGSRINVRKRLIQNEHFGGCGEQGQQGGFLFFSPGQAVDLALENIIRLKNRTELFGIFKGFEIGQSRIHGIKNKFFPDHCGDNLGFEILEEDRDFPDKFPWRIFGHGPIPVAIASFDKTVLNTRDQAADDL